LPALPPSVRKAIVFVGMRRSGKTWVLYQLINALQKKEGSLEKSLYINFEDDRLVGIEDQLQTILDAYFELYPQHIGSSDLHFFFDEIHEVPGWEKFIRRLLDQEKINLYLTGSSAKMLSKEIATSLRGRNLVREIFPFSFSEYLDYKDVKITQQLSSKQKIFVKHHLLHYLEFGGFPETLDASPALHRELLQGYIDTVIYRDIVERYHVTNTSVLRYLLRHCLQNAASILSVHKIYLNFRSQGHAIGKTALYQFMDYFEDAYCLFSISAYEFSYRKSQLKPKKIYPVDTGMITAFTLKSTTEMAARLETAVFLHLRRRTEDIYYYHTVVGKEVDFITLSAAGQLKLFQVSLSLKESKTKERELSALIEAMKELNVSEGTIITLDDEADVIHTINGVVQVISLWQFLFS
jgi:predicted AAA+ superfamily ATPase